jgi:formylglycine-generating enzyme required for sulfatase activity
VPPPPAFGTVLPAPPLPRESARVARGIIVGAVAGVAVLGALMWFLRPMIMGDAATSAPAAVAAPASDAPAPAAALAGGDAGAAASAAAPVVAKPCPDGMALVPGGKFFMGSDADDAVLASARPAHPAAVESFCIDISEVTLGAYRACSTKGECKRAFRDSAWPRGTTDEASWKAQQQAHGELCNENRDDRDDHPVNCVDWAQAQAYCEWRGATLPTEAQWEFAARGSDGRIYSWGDAKPSAAHMNGAGKEYVAWRESKGLPAHAVLYDTDDGFVGTAPVGASPQGRTQHGLSDMAGNVFEWTADEFRPYEGADAAPGEKGRRVIRGGAFNSFQPQFADPALRFPQAEEAHTHGIGFRCAATPRPV